MSKYRSMPWKIISKSALGLSLLALPLFTTARNTNYFQVTAQESRPRVTPEEIIEQTQKLIGKTVTLRGAVEEIKSESVFALADELYFGGQRVLVIDRSGKLLPELPENGIVQVTGTVDRVITSNIIENQDLDLSPDVVKLYKDRPAIIAESITLSPSASEITENPQNFYNKPVAVKGKVEEVLDNNTFTLSEYNLSGGKDLLVLSIAPQPTPEINAEIFARGSVRPFSLAELERDYNLNLNPELKQRLESEYSQQAVLVIDNITPAKINLSDPEVDINP
ncbi:MAG TPA: hypothetical protein V6C71_08870 [Coleofasciculaceae cyanobacterium]|jgi:hypothetical protein